jgi:hypothetical protein
MKLGLINEIMMAPFKVFVHVDMTINHKVIKLCQNSSCGKMITMHDDHYY